ncbi:UNVERIFIED_CONTAM: hypothetical protein PYX00_008314 [Menopon gallinae]|uniref:Decaprenyl-diphosphate synthase subunit 1 n=1 Tax=Menopon gallinae TaxID=328185 RepID=A0AAW2HMS2_9NEOP
MRGEKSLFRLFANIAHVHFLLLFQNQNSQKRINTVRNNHSLSSTTQSAAIGAPSPVPISVSLQTSIPVYYNINDFSAFKLSVQSENIRRYSTLRTQHPGSLPDTSVDPYRLLEDDLKDIYDDIRSELRKNTNQEELQTIATYYFDGQGKALRPMVAILMARAINHHMYGDDRGLGSSQRDVAMISEMIHSASLIHDDVIDQSDFRRGKPSVNVLWNHKKVSRLFSFLSAFRSEIGPRRTRM